MKIMILTRKDRFTVPIYLEKVVKARSTEIVAIVTVTTPPYMTSVSFLKKRLQTLGTKDAFLKAVQLYSYATMDMVSRFIKLGRFYSLRTLTHNYGVPLYHTDKIGTAKFLEFVRDLGPDIILSVACPRIIGKSLLEIPRLGCINVHCSLLPKGRGRDPGFWPLALGHTETGITIHYMDEKMDNGDIILQRTMPIHAEDTLESLYRRIAKVSADLIVTTLDDIEKGTVLRLPNNEEEATYFGVPAKSDICQFRKRGRKLIRFADCIPWVA